MLKSNFYEHIVNKGQDGSTSLLAIVRKRGHQKLLVVCNNAMGWINISVEQGGITTINFGYRLPPNILFSKLKGSSAIK